MLTPRRVASSVEELLAGATSRSAFQPAETRSSVGFERVVIDGEALVVKYIHLDLDFTMRVTGDIGCRSVRAWEAGLYDVAAAFVDHAVVGAARGWGRNGWGGALLMRDVSASLVPPGDGLFSPEHHALFLDSLAGMCAATWGWRDAVGLLPYADRWAFFGEAGLDGERSLGWPERVPEIAAEGWSLFDSRAPADVASVVGALRRDAAPLGLALSSTPSCFLHGDWKASNLGVGPDGRAVLLDWVYLGEGPACHELGWYLALNRAKLPCPKEEVIDQFRSALARHGVDVGGWWDRQLALALLGTLVQFGWEKAFGDDDELGWWCDRAREGAALL